MLLKLAWRNIWRNKRRTLITVASVLFGVVLSSLMMSLKEGMYTKMIDSMVGAFTGYAQIHQDGYWSDRSLENSMMISDSLDDLLKNQNGLTGYTPRIESFALANSQNISKGTLVLGIDPEKEAEFAKLDTRISHGQYLKKSDEGVLIGDGLAEYLELNVQDTIILLGQGYHGSSAAGKYPVKGIVKFGSPELSNRLVILSLEAAQWFFGMEGLVTSLVLHPDNPVETSQLTKNLGKEIGNNYEVMPWQELTPELVNMIETDRTEGYVFMFILYMVIGFGIFGTMLMMLEERKYEFGVLIAIGMKRVKLSLIVFIELLILSIMGAIAGIIAAIPVCLYFYYKPIRFGEELQKMSEEYGIEAVLQTSLEPSIFIQQAIVVAIISILIGIYPLSRLLRLNIIKSMRS